MEATLVSRLDHVTMFKKIWCNFDRKWCVPHGAAGMTLEHRLALIIAAIRALQIRIPVSRGRVALLLEPWPDLYREAMVRRDTGWINLLQAAAARIERAPE
jgi:hypothetical protein